MTNHCFGIFIIFSEFKKKTTYEFAVERQKYLEHIAHASSEFCQNNIEIAQRLQILDF